MEKLEYVLGRLNAAPEVWQAPMFPKAWQTLLVTPLTKGTCKYIDLYINDSMECSHFVHAEVLNHFFHSCKSIVSKIKKSLFFVQNVTVTLNEM